MGNRLTQIATRTGDDGTTGLGDGSRVAKDHLREQAMGDMDELPDRPRRDDLPDSFHTEGDLARRPSEGSLLG